MNGPVICGVEDPSGAGAVDVARELAERYEVPLLYVHVLDGAGELEEAARMLHETTAGTGELAIERGPHPADRLVQVAEQRDASFLVVGNHGPRSSLLGSISADLSRRAPCPVMVVPPGAASADLEGGGDDEPAVEGGILRFRGRTHVREVA